MASWHFPMNQVIGSQLVQISTNIKDAKITSTYTAEIAESVFRLLHIESILYLSYPLHPIIPLILLGNGKPDILPYCPVIVDIYDGFDMSDTKLKPTNPVTVQITICLAIIMFYIPSFLETYHLRFPELTDESISSKRNIKLTQFVCSSMYLALRIVLLLLLPYDRHEIGFLIKTAFIVYYHYRQYDKIL